MGGLPCKGRLPCIMGTPTHGETSIHGKTPIDVNSHIWGDSHVWEYSHMWGTPVNGETHIDGKTPIHGDFHICPCMGRLPYVGNPIYGDTPEEWRGCWMGTSIAASRRSQEEPVGGVAVGCIGARRGGSQRWVEDPKCVIPRGDFTINPNLNDM